MKIVNKQHVFKNTFTAKLMENELTVLKETYHPHIVKCLALLEDDVNFYIISELVKGGELYDHIVKMKRLGER